MNYLRIYRVQLYERLSLKKKDMPINILKNAINRMSKPVRDSRLIPWLKSDVISEGSIITFYYYYLEKKDKIREAVIKLLDYNLDYFFGSWRYEVPTDEGKIDPEWWKRISWASYFRDAIFWGSCIGAWDKIRKIAQYPTDECLNSEPWEHISFRVWYLIIAAVLRDEPLQSLVRHTDLIDKLKSRREKLLLDILRPILCGDAEKTNEQLAIYLKYYKKFEFKKPQITERVSVDGTFLVNFGRYKGLKIKYPEEYADHIVML